MSLPFVHLHVHTDFSLLDGTAKCKDIAHLAKEMGMPALAITDHGTMSGCIELTNCCASEGIKPIYGCEFYVAPSDYLKHDPNEEHSKGYHLICLAESYKGYINMCHLNEEAWLRGYYYKPRVDKNLLRKYHEDVICLSACLAGEVAHKFLLGDDEGAEKAADEYAEIFGPEHFYLELQNHRLPEDEIVIPKIIALARRKNIPLVATNDSHYTRREDAEAHDLFLCIGTQTTIKDDKRFRMPGGPEYYFKTPEEMAALFPEAPDALENTVKIAERCCNVHIPTVDADKANHYPEYPEPEGVDREQHLRQLCHEGLMWRFHFDPDKDEITPERQAIIDRMNYEIGIIARMKFVSYYLVVWDFLHYAAKIGVPLGPGRGSGAGSMVAYLIGITHIDPLRYNLLFERFLNPERVSPPDFDIDLCERRRHEVIEYVRDKYGASRVVQIGTFGTLKAKQVVKDVARAMGRSFAEGNMVCKMIPADPHMTLDIALNGSEKYHFPPNQELKSLIENTPWVAELWKFAKTLEGCNRNMSIHAAGVIIGDMDVADVAPIARGAGDEAITQFSAIPCESLGLLKMDFLGLKTLTLIQDALDLIEKNTGRKVISNDIPIDDQHTYDMLNEGKTIAVFQLESGGMQKLCRQWHLTRIEDIIALIAIYRPGPMEFIPEYLGRKEGKIPLDYDVPSMEPILAETCGIMLYQEQIMQVAQAVAGFSLGQADILRRAIGKKKIKVMEAMFVTFQEGCRKNGIKDEVSKNIWDKILKFAGYGFNKSHSAAYGMLTYRTAWLKANYPAEFMAAVLTSELTNSVKMAFYLKECREMNISILPPDVNVCDAMFSVDGPNIRFGLSAIKGVGMSVVSEIIKAREEGGHFKDISDFCERVHGNSKRLMESLIKAGAMDCFGLRRSQLLNITDEAMARAAESAKDKKNGQLSLFDMFAPADQEAVSLNVPDIPEWPLRELLGYEKELLGFYVSGHPIGECQDLVERFQSHDLSEIATLPHKTTVRVGAYVSGVSYKTTKKDGRAWVILNLESRECHLECLFFPDAYEAMLAQNREIFKPETVVFIDGEVNKRDEEEPSSLLGRIIYSAASMPGRFIQEIQVKLFEDKMTDDQLTGLQKLTADNRGNIPLIYFLHCKDGSIVTLRDNEHGVFYSPEFWKELERLVGPENIFARIDRKPKPAPKRHFGHYNDD